ncbi:CRISPR-associated endonuclease Cas2 [Desulfococcaceae bacterium HSG8]|nr:CRISPR-associated endonuclease Cas2 [Desulfococcaceae bacterium HSG8]
MRRGPVIVTYDITKNKIRSGVYKIIKEWRLDGQKSVHECRLKMREAEELFLQLSEPLDKETDSLLMIWLESHRPVLCRGLGRNNIHRTFWHIR